MNRKAGRLFFVLFCGVLFLPLFSFAEEENSDEAVKVAEGRSVEEEDIALTRYQLSLRLYDADAKKEGLKLFFNVSRDYADLLYRHGALRELVKRRLPLRDVGLFLLDASRLFLDEHTAYLGAEIVPLDRETAMDVGAIMPPYSGVLVKSIDPQGPLSFVDVHQGDVIVEMSNSKIRNVEDYNLLVNGVLRPGDYVPLVFVRDSFYWDAKTVTGSIVRYNDEMFQSMMWFALYALWSSHPDTAEKTADAMREIERSGESVMGRKWREIALLLNAFVLVQRGQEEEAMNLIKKNGRFAAGSVDEVLKEKVYWQPLLKLSSRLAPFFWREPEEIAPPDVPYGNHEAYPDLKGRFPQQEEGLERWFQELRERMKKAERNDTRSSELK